MTNLGSSQCMCACKHRHQGKLDLVRAPHAVHCLHPCMPTSAPNLMLNAIACTVDLLHVTATRGREINSRNSRSATILKRK
jgi:hypothetical protein